MPKSSAILLDAFLAFEPELKETLKSTKHGWHSAETISEIKPSDQYRFETLENLERLNTLIGFIKENKNDLIKELSNLTPEMIAAAINAFKEKDKPKDHPDLSKGYFTHFVKLYAWSLDVLMVRFRNETYTTMLAYSENEVALAYKLRNFFSKFQPLNKEGVALDTIYQSIYKCLPYYQRGLVTAYFKKAGGSSPTALFIRAAASISKHLASNNYSEPVASPELPHNIGTKTRTTRTSDEDKVDSNPPSPLTEQKQTEPMNIRSPEQHLLELKTNIDTLQRSIAEKKALAAKYNLDTKNGQEIAGLNLKDLTKQLIEMDEQKAQVIKFDDTLAKKIGLTESETFAWQQASIAQFDQTTTAYILSARNLAWGYTPSWISSPIGAAVRSVAGKEIAGAEVAPTCAMERLRATIEAQTKIQATKSNIEKIDKEIAMIMQELASAQSKAEQLTTDIARKKEEAARLLAEAEAQRKTAETLKQQRETEAKKIREEEIKSEATPTIMPPSKKEVESSKKRTSENKHAISEASSPLTSEAKTPGTQDNAEISQLIASFGSREQQEFREQQDAAAMHGAPSPEPTYLPAALGGASGAVIGWFLGGYLGILLAPLTLGLSLIIAPIVCALIAGVVSYTVVYLASNANPPEPTTTAIADRDTQTPIVSTHAKLSPQLQTDPVRSRLPIANPKEEKTATVVKQPADSQDNAHDRVASQTSKRKLG